MKADRNVLVIDENLDSRRVESFDEQTHPADTSQSILAKEQKEGKMRKTMMPASRSVQSQGLD